ncbi:hypothetical protein [Hydrogenophaga sp. IBVHS2]|uniref:hypothetical protein n=1 Tax=Hydrogenophaga sp. IBVHS2 TaxID=1985170 RepID=UPI000A2D19BD|nr:hypothetical protein [Hydrogenophaga sp. IBVHS2]OSZ62533.1 hypothetical protein CAP38_14755 [Hydrogenophaga sp. IBVHS2]
MKKALLIKTAVALALTTPMLSMAESQLVVAATGSATARLGFQVVIPRVLFLGVGTGSTGLATNTTVDTVSFNYTNNPEAVGLGGPANQITGNEVPVRVVGNNGNITLSASTTGPLANGSGDVIPWSQITAESTQTTLPAPVIPDTGAGPTVNVTPTSGKVTDRSATWRFSYANTITPPAGTYGGGNAGPRVIYTAAMP